MLHSMTSSSHHLLNFEYGNISIDIKSINSRFLDINLNIPEEINHLENKIRNLINKHILRGRISIKIDIQYYNNYISNDIDIEKIYSLSKQIDLIKTIIPNTQYPDFLNIINFCQKKQNDYKNIQLDDICEKLTCVAIKELKIGRHNEGITLCNLLIKYSENFLKILQQIDNLMLEASVVYQKNIFDKLQENLKKFASLTKMHMNENEFKERIVNEINMYLIKIDICEEISRLQSHISSMQNLLKYGDNKNLELRKSPGKQLDFLIQEIQREVNTMTAKSFSIHITKLSLELKLLTEQMREQVQNLE